MAADSNMGFQQRTIPSSYNPHMVSFQSGAINSTTVMISGGMSSSGLNSNTSLMFLSGNPSMTNMPAISAAGSSSSNAHLDLVHEFKPGTVSGSVWSAREVAKLNECLIKYAHEPKFTKYIKIAATLPEKTIRDVALRCHWTSNKESGKRRKTEEHYLGKKIKDIKGKMLASSPTANIRLDSMSPYLLMMNNMNCSNQFSHEVFVMRGTKWKYAYNRKRWYTTFSQVPHLLDENVQILGQISANLATLKIQENVKLFLHTRNNLTSILHRLSKMPPIKNQVPGMMSPLPPLPLSINEELLKAVVSFNREDAIYGAPSGMNS